MKYFYTLLILVMFAFTACDSIVARQQVMFSYDKDEVVTLPSSKYEFLIRKQNGEVIWLRNEGGSFGEQLPNNVRRIPLFKPNDPDKRPAAKTP